MPSAPHLRTRPQTVTLPAATGLQILLVHAERDSYLYVPPAYTPTHPAPMALLLHGVGGHARHGLDLLRLLADEAGAIPVAPAATDSTWDVISCRRYCTDVALIECCLESAFLRYAIDAAYLAIGDFSEGASYALWLGRDNGDLFSHVIAFSQALWHHRHRAASRRASFHTAGRTPCCP